MLVLNRILHVKSHFVVTKHSTSVYWADFFGAPEWDLNGLRLELFSIIKPVLFLGLIHQKRRLCSTVLVHSVIKQITVPAAALPNKFKIDDFYLFLTLSHKLS